MNNQPRKTSGKFPNSRAMLDYFMALLMLFFGFFIIFSKEVLGYDYFEGSWLVSGSMKWIIGILFMFYGIFRAYRGFQLSKNKPGNEE